MTSPGDTAEAGPAIATGRWGLGLVSFGLGQWGYA